MSKYASLTSYLAGLAADKREETLDFAHLDELVGGLPLSARVHRAWWANSSQAHSVAWRVADWRVHSVDLAAGSVTFTRQQDVDNTYVDEPRSDEPTVDPQSVVLTPPGLTETPEYPVVDARVAFRWQRLGVVTLDAAGKLAFPSGVPATPGLYRLTLRNTTGRNQIYIGETINLRQRISHYRVPRPSQTTNIRINALILEHLRSGLETILDVSDQACLESPSTTARTLDLSRKSGRLLAESAALVLARLDGRADITNLG